MKQSTNLISQSTINHFGNQAAKRAWRNLAFAAFALSGVCVLSMQFAVQQIRRETTQQNSRGDYPQQVADENSRLRVELQRAQAKFQEQRELRCDRSPLTILQLLVGVQREFDGNLTVETFDFNLDTANVQSSSPTGGPATPQLVGLRKNASGRLSLQVITNSTTRSSQFLQLLKDSGYFQQVKLNSPLSRADRDGTDLRFGVVCSF